jgi:hypothetical protein
MAAWGPMGHQGTELKFPTGHPHSDPSPALDPDALPRLWNSQGAMVIQIRGSLFNLAATSIKQQT